MKIKNIEREKTFQPLTLLKSLHSLSMLCSPMLCGPMLCGPMLIDVWCLHYSDNHSKLGLY
jgi:hypothetical protein